MLGPIKDELRLRDSTLLGGSNSCFKVTEVQHDYFDRSSLTTFNCVRTLFFVIGGSERAILESWDSNAFRFSTHPDELLSLL